MTDPHLNLSYARWNWTTKVWFFIPGYLFLFPWTNFHINVDFTFMKVPQELHEKIRKLFLSNTILISSFSKFHMFSQQYWKDLRKQASILSLPKSHRFSQKITKILIANKLLFLLFQVPHVLPKTLEWPFTENDLIVNGITTDVIFNGSIEQSQLCLFITL